MSEAEILAERMLWAIGGRPAWAGVTTTILHSQQYRRDDPTDLSAVVMLDYRQPRFRIDTTGTSAYGSRVVDSGGDSNWQLDSQGRASKVSEDPLARHLRWYAAHVYRTVQRIAARDPGIKLTAGRNDTLEVYERNRRIAWYRLDARGEPLAMGAYDDSVGVICGPWTVGRANAGQNDIRYPAWVARPDGSWRATAESLAVNVRLDDGLFAQPMVVAEQ